MSMNCINCIIIFSFKLHIYVYCVYHDIVYFFSIQDNQINSSEVLTPIVSIETEENTICNQQTSTEVSSLCTNPSKGIF